MTDTRIKPCPHCGGTAYLTQNYSYKCRAYFVFVKCDICGAQGKIYNSPEEPAAENWKSQPCNDAIGAWNQRTTTEEEIDRIAEQVVMGYLQSVLEKARNNDEQEASE